MPGIARRLRFAAALSLAIVLLGVGEYLPATGARHSAARITIDHFMTGLACVESGGRYNARNPSSGAYGKYQIMPRNWPRWADRYLGYRRAARTAYHQEIVARARIQRLHDQRGSWRRVAYWWLTGKSDPNEARWSRKARGYVDGVMSIARRAASPASASRVPDRCFPRNFQAPARLPRARVVVKGQSVNARTAPGYENRLIGVVRRGDVLAVLDRRRDRRGKPWIEVVLPTGRIGWVARWYTRSSE